MVVWRIIGFVSLLAVGLGAQTDRLHFPQLPLHNGIVLQDATLLSVDPRTQRVTVVDGQRRMSTLPVAVLPAHVREQLAVLPSAGATTRVTQPAPRPARSAPAPAKAAPAPTTGEGETDLAAVQALVREHVEFYFTHEFRPGTGSVIVLSNMIQLHPSRPIANWPGRHRVQGRVGLRFYDSGKGSFDTRVRQFTAEVRTLPEGDWEVVSFTHR